MKKIIIQGIWSLYNNKFSGLADRELYGILVRRINFHILGVKGLICTVVLKLH